MPALIPELKSKAKIGKITSDLCSLLKRGDTKKIIVVCDNPQEFEAATIAQWEKGTSILRADLTSSNGSSEGMLIESDIAIRESITFAAAPPVNLEADVVFATVSQLQNELPKCDVIVATLPMKEELIAAISRNMHRDGRIILYG